MNFFARPNYLVARITYSRCQNRSALGRGEHSSEVSRWIRGYRSMNNDSNPWAINNQIELAVSWQSATTFSCNGTFWKLPIIDE